MTPAKVTDEMVALFTEGTAPEAVKRTFIGPDDMPNVEPCEAIVHRSHDGVTAVMRIPLDLEPGELEKLKAGGRVWLTMWGGLSPFAVEVVEPPRDDRPHSRACGMRCPGHGQGCARDCPTCHPSPLTVVRHVSSI